MNTTQLTTPSFDVLTHEELVGWLRIDSGTDPLATAMLLGSGTAIVEDICNVTMRQTSYLVVSPAPCGTITIPLSPIMSVDTVQYIDDSGAFADVTGWMLSGNVLTLPAAFTGNVNVQCTVGWASPEAIPQSLRHAVAIIVAAGYDSRSEIDDQTMVTVNRLVAGQRRYVS